MIRCSGYFNPSPLASKNSRKLTEFAGSKLEPFLEP